MATTVDERIAATQQEINEALKAAGLQNGHGLTVQVREQQTDWGFRAEGNGKLTAVAEPSSLVACRTKTFPERKDGTVNVAGIVEFARVIAPEYDARVAARNQKNQRAEENAKVLHEVDLGTRANLQAKSSAAGITITLTPDQFAACVAALTAAGLI